MVWWSRVKRPVHRRVDTLVGRQSQVQGDVHFLGGLHCDGLITGDVTAEDDTDSVLTLSHHGTIRGTVRAPYQRIDGQVEGDVHSTQRLELGPRARIQGDVHYTLLEMAVGAEVNGRLRHISGQSSRAVLSLEAAGPEGRSRAAEEGA
jgi:cytoskeletal protein CcmA (bactofilin family)